MSYQDQTTTNQGTELDENLLTKPLYETLATDDRLGTFTAAMELAGFVPILEAPHLFTVFAIPENVLDRMAGSLRDAVAERRTADVKRWAGRHIVKGRQLEADLKLAAYVFTLEDEALPVSHHDGYVQVNEFRIDKADIACTNGVIHIVDWVKDR